MSTLKVGGKLMNSERPTTILRRVASALANVTIALGLIASLLCPWFAITLFPWCVATGAVAAGVGIRLWLKPPSGRLGRGLRVGATGIFFLCLLVVAGICVEHWTRDQGRLQSLCGHSAWRFLNVVPEADIASLGVRLCGVMGFIPRDQARDVHALLKKTYRQMERDRETANAGNIALLSVVAPHVEHAFILHPRSSSEKPKGMLLFLHGAGAPMAIYPWLLSDLADRENLIVVCPSWPDGDWSQAGAAEYAIERARSVAAAGAVDSERIYLGGISMGGAGGWRVLDAEPKMFRGFICISGYGSARTAIDTPVLVVEGGKDAFTASDAELRRANPQSRLVVIPDDDHFVLLRSTNKVTDIICAWMAELETP